jgi:HEAT repeat protein
MLRGGNTIPVVLPNTANVTATSPPAKRFKALSALLLLAFVGAVAGCGEEPEKTGPAGREAIIPPSYPEGTPALEIPAKAPDPDGKIGWYVKMLGTGDQEEVAWVTLQLKQAGERAVRPLGERLRGALGRNAMLAENVLKVFEAGLDPTPITEVLLLAAKDRSDRVRAFSAVALGRTGSAKAIPVLLDLASEGSPLVSKPAIRSIEKLKSVEGARGLKGRFRTVLSPVLRPAAVPVIGRLLPEKEAFEFLKSLFAEKDIVLVIRAAMTLEERGDPAGREELLRKYREEALPPIHEEALLNALGDMGDTRVLPELITRASSGSLARRQFAVAVLGSYREPAARAALWEATKAEGASLRLEAWHSLWLSGDEKVLTRLHLLLRSADPVERRHAATVLGQIKSKLSVPHLAGAMENETELALVPHYALSLAAIDRPEGALPVVRSLPREPRDEPYMAITANNLAKALIGFTAIGDDARKALLELVKSPRLSVRLNAARALARHGKGAPSKAAVSKLFDDPSPDVREIAVKAWLNLPGTKAEALRAVYEKATDPARARTIAAIAEQIVYRWNE